MRKLLRPNVLIPVIFVAALLAALVGLTDVKRISELIVGFDRVDLLYFFLLMVAYEAVRGLQWHLLLRALGVRAPLRTQIFTFLGGEIAKTLPIGNYFQNYLLQQSDGTDFGLSSAATTLIIWLEVTVSLVALLILGIDGWPWLRPAIVGGVAAFGLLVWALYTLGRSARLPRWMMEHKTSRALVEGLRRFRAGAATLLHPRLLLMATGLCAIYLVIAGVGLHVIMHGLGLGGVTLGQALAVYFFSLAIGLIIPIPVDIGLTELGGVGALLVIGANRNTAVGVMLLNRVLSIVAAFLIALVAAAFLRDELRAVLRNRPRRAPRPREGAEQA